MKQGYRIRKSVLTTVVIAGVLLLITGAISVFALQLVSEEENTATVIEMANHVEAHPRPADGWQPATVGMMVYSGGQVRTGTASAAHLRLLEGIVRLSADTLFTVKESVTRQGKLSTELFLQEGRLWLHLTTDQPHELDVETGSAVAAVRDTRFSVKVTDGQTFLSVAEGTVVLTAQGQSVNVTAGQQAVVEPGQPPATPEPMGSEERMLWATEGEMPELALSASTPTPTSTVMPTPTPTSTPVLMPTPAVTLTPALSPTPTFTPTMGGFGIIEGHYIVDGPFGACTYISVKGVICALDKPFTLTTNGQDPEAGEYTGQFTFTPAGMSGGSWQYVATACAEDMCATIKASATYRVQGVAGGEPVIIMDPTTQSMTAFGISKSFDMPSWQIKPEPAHGDCSAD
jgi:hypothetical protein